MKEQLQKRNIEIENLEAKETSGKKFITGLIPYNKKSVRMSITYSACEFEELSPAVFNKTLADNAPVYANFNHDDNSVLGNTRSGTLKLTNQENGLLCECELPNSDIGNRAYETVKRGDTTKMSFEFYPFDWIEQDDTVILRSAKLTAVSFCVINPAYPDTEVQSSLRSICNKKSIDITKVERALEENKIMDKEQEESIKKLISMLSELLPKEEPQSQEEPPKEEQKDSCEKQDDKSKREPSDSKEQSKTDTLQESNEKPDEEKLAQLKEIMKELSDELSAN